MSANKGFETKIFEDENTDSGIVSGPMSEYLSDQLLSGELDPRADAPAADSDKNVISECTDSGVDLHLSECISNVKISDPGPTTQGPLIVIDSDTKTQDIPPLAILFQQDDDGDTQLHIAAVHGCEKSVGTLIRVCPDKAWLEVPNDYGHTPLHLAVMSGHSVVARMLVRAGASSAIRDHTGETPLHKAVAANHLECLQALLAPLPDQPPVKSSVLDQKNFNGQTCVHVATAAGSVEMLKTLIHYGADINAMEGLAGWTALHMAARRGDTRVAQYLLDRREVRRDAEDYAGRTPRRVARRLPAALLARLGDDDDDESDDEYDSDSDSENLFEKLRQNINPINVA